MDNVLDHYYKVNSYLLLVLGFRTANTSRMNRIQSIFVLLFLFFGVVSQVLTIVMSDLNKATLFTKSSPLIINMIFLIKQWTLIRKRNEICYIFDHIKYDWTTIADKLERRIMKEYAMSARTHVFLFLAMTVPPGFLTSISVLMPWILDIVSPQNQTRSSIINVDIGYVFDQKQNQTAFVTTIGIIIVLGTIVLNGFEALLTVTMQHASSLFRVTSYRLKQVLNEAQLNLVNEKRSHFGDQGTLISAINLHTRALEFSEFLRANFMVSYGILIALGTISLSTGLYCVRLCVEDIDGIMTAVILVFSHFGYAFYCNHIVQLATEESESVFYNAYHTNWYNTSVSIQKQLRFIIHRSCDGFTCEMWNVYKPSLEGFTAFVKTAFSYFMLIRSIQ